MKHTLRSPLAAAEDQKEVVDLGKTSCLCRQYAADYKPPQTFELEACRQNQRKYNID